MYMYTDTRLHVVNAPLFHTLSPELYICLLYKYGVADSLNGILSKNSLTMAITQDIIIWSGGEEKERKRKGGVEKS